MSNINKIKVSGQTYSIQDENACKVVELTQAQYDALPASAKTSNTLFVITDATAGDLSNYYTKSETDDLLDTKLDASAYTPTDLSNYYTKSETSGATEISTALASKQDTLVSGTNIKTINNESILGSGNITIEGGVSESAFTSYSAATDARISEDEEVTAAALNDLNEALSGKQDTLIAGSGITITGNVISAEGGSSITIDPSLDSGSTNPVANSAITTAINAKQATLVSGTNIKTINNESILGSGNIEIQGGGKAINAGTNISITTGETADTINCTLPITADTNTKAPKIKIGSDYSLLTSNSSVNPYNITKAHSNILFGNNNKVFNTSGSGGELSWNFLLGQQNSAQGVGAYKPTSAYNMFCGVGNTTQNSYGFASGNYNTLSKGHQFVVGDYHAPKNDYETNFGKYSISVSASTAFGNSGNTLFSVANGYNTANTHNALEIRQNGDIYIADTNDTSTTNYYEKPMIKLQDALGGGSSYTAGDGIDITNDVISVTGKVDTSAITTSITSASTNTQVPSAKAVYDQLGGLKLVKLSQSEYDALSTKDNSTLYVIVN